MGYSIVAVVMMGSLLMIISSITVSIVVVAALDPICAASEKVFCSPNGTFASQKTQSAVLVNSKNLYACYDGYYPDQGTGNPSRFVYQYSSCSAANGDVDVQSHECHNCLERAVEIIEQHCPNSVGAQYGTDVCCIRYETYPFC